MLQIRPIHHSSICYRLQLVITKYSYLFSVVLYLTLVVMKLKKLKRFQISTCIERKWKHTEDDGFACCFKERLIFFTVSKSHMIFKQTATSIFRSVQIYIFCVCRPSKFNLLVQAFLDEVVVYYILLHHHRKCDKLVLVLSHLLVSVG